MSAVPAISHTVDQLRRQMIQSQVQTRERCTITTGYPAIDQLLPQSGLQTGSMIEWVSDAPGMRTTSIALKCASQFLNSPGALAVVDPNHDFHAASISHLGIPLSRLLLIRPGQSPQQSGDTHYNPASRQQQADTLWALEQLARCSGVKVVLTWIDQLSSTAQRRLQLAIENSGVTVFLIRPAAALRQTSWADLRFHVQSSAPGSQNQTAGTGVKICLLRSRHAVQHHGHALLESDHETGDVSEIPELARSTPATTAAG